MISIFSNFDPVFRFLGRLFSLILCGNPACKISLETNKQYETKRISYIKVHSAGRAGKTPWRKTPVFYS